MQMSVCQHSILKVTSSVIVTHPGEFDWHKTMFSFHWINILLISVTFYTYLANIVFSCDLDFKCQICKYWYILYCG